jgi:hypothetical protein
VVEGQGGRALVLILAVLSAGAVLCLFDADAFSADQSPSPDSCVGGALVSVAPVLLGLALSGRLEERGVWPLHAVSICRLDPPPKPQTLL